MLTMNPAARFGMAIDRGLVAELDAHDALMGEELQALKDNLNTGFEKLDAQERLYPYQRAMKTVALLQDYLDAYTERRDKGLYEHDSNETYWFEALIKERLEPLVKELKPVQIKHVLRELDKEDREFSSWILKPFREPFLVQYYKLPEYGAPGNTPRFHELREAAVARLSEAAVAEAPDESAEGRLDKQA